MVTSISFSSLMIIIFSFSLSLLNSSEAQQKAEVKPCQSHTCDGGSTAVPIRFPFWLPSIQPIGCGYPGFDLECRNNLTILKLKNSHHSDNTFIVREINYESQYLLLTDPDGCLPKRVLELSIDAVLSPFSLYPRDTFVFYNCSSEFRDVGFVVPCLSGDNYTVLVVRKDSFGPEFGKYMEELRGCKAAREVEVPGIWSARTWMRETLVLGWREPDCRRCESQGGRCGFKDRQRMEELHCEGGSTGLADGAKYSLIISLGVPVLLCLVALAYSMGKKAILRRQRAGQASVAAQPQVVIQGLDGSIIEKYPKIMLGESKRLPNPEENVCPICLSEYEAKEELRTLPDCSHYFHAICIDQWLQFRGTCPLCRSSPENRAPTSTS